MKYIIYTLWVHTFGKRNVIIIIIIIFLDPPRKIIICLIYFFSHIIYRCAWLTNKNTDPLQK